MKAFPFSSLTCGLCLFSLLSGVPAHAEIYRHVDKSGHVYFSDRPFTTYGPVAAGSTPLPSLGGATQASQLTTSLQIYKYVDHRGTVHLTDRPPDSRYKLVYSGTTLARPEGSLFSKGKGYERYDDLVKLVAQSTGLEPALLHAVITAESAYNPDALSPKGAVGLMQLMPGTARRYGVSDSADPYSNIDGGARYLKDLLAMFDNNLTLALAGYNAGENAVIRHGKSVPPYRETQNYVVKVQQLYNAYRMGQ
jgi:hypothetical protein